MSTVFRLQNQEPLEVSDAWVLAEQIEAVNVWLTNSANSQFVRGAILDIGFNSRLGTSGIAIQGETVPLEFMRQLVENKITLCLSIYPNPDEETA